MEEIRIDVRNHDSERIAEVKRCTELCFIINH